MQKQRGLDNLENPDTVDYIIQDPRRFIFELRRRLIGPPAPAFVPAASSESNAGIEALLVAFFVLGIRVFISATETLGAEGFGIGVPRTVMGCCCRGEAKGRRVNGGNGSPWKSGGRMKKKQGLHFATLSVVLLFLFSPLLLHLHLYGRRGMFYLI